VQSLAPSALSCYILTPPPALKDRKEIGAWLTKQHLPTGGVRGIRMTLGRPDVLLVTSASEQIEGLTPDVEDIDFDGAVAWYQARFLEEVTSWKTPEELLDLLAAVKGRRRFQTFGNWYEKKASPTQNEELIHKEKRTYPSGGAAKAKAEPQRCPHGLPIRWLRLVSEEESEHWIQRPLSLVNKLPEVDKL
jgi:hypothetical protein